jgi:(2R)-ethylmalonyl-CoA mutase
MVAGLKAAALAELAEIELRGGAVKAIDYMKRRLVASNAERVARIERGEQVVVGVNRFVETEASPLSAGGAGIEVVEAGVEAEQVARLEAWRAARDAGLVGRALGDLERAAREGRNVMEPSIACAKAGVTTGEWSATLRRVFGEYRAPTGIGGGVTPVGDEDGSTGVVDVRIEVERVSARLGRRLKILIGKPGLDGHSNGAEQIAVRARDCGMDVVYQGIRSTPGEIVRAAVEESVDAIGLSILSGSHLSLCREVMAGLAREGAPEVPVIAGGIIPPEDAAALRDLGVAAVYTPKDFRLNEIMADIVRIVERRAT